MAQNTTISYVHHSWSGWRGCQHAALPDGTEHAGCQNCFAEAMSKRNPTVLGTWGPDGTRVRPADAYWKQPVKWDRAAEESGERRRVLWDFSDPFEDWQGTILDHKGETVWRDTPLLESKLQPITMSDLRRDAFALIDQTPNLDWLLLTKRPWNVRKMWPCRECGRTLDTPCLYASKTARRENVWLGVSVSDQQSADQLLPELLKLRDLVRVLFVSVEPLVKPVDLSNLTWDTHNAHGPRHITVDALHGRQGAGYSDDGPRLDWVIVGGESGPRRRPCGIEWIQSLADQCKSANVPCFIKQDSALWPGQQGLIPDDLWAVKEFPDA